MVSRKKIALIVSILACLFSVFVSSTVMVFYSFRFDVSIGAIAVNNWWGLLFVIVIGLGAYANAFYVAYSIPKRLADKEAEEKSEKRREAFFAEMAKLASENTGKEECAKFYYPAMTGGKVYNPYAQMGKGYE